MLVAATGLVAHLQSAEVPETLVGAVPCAKFVPSVHVGAVFVTVELQAEGLFAQVRQQLHAVGLTSCSVGRVSVVGSVALTALLLASPSVLVATSSLVAVGTVAGVSISPVAVSVLELSNPVGLLVGSLSLDHSESLGSASVVPQGEGSVSGCGGPVFQMLGEESAQNSNSKVGRILDTSESRQTVH